MSHKRLLIAALLVNAVALGVLFYWVLDLRGGETSSGVSAGTTYTGGTTNNVDSYWDVPALENQSWDDAAWREDPWQDWQEQYERDRMQREIDDLRACINSDRQWSVYC